MQKSLTSIAAAEGVEMAAPSGNPFRMKELLVLETANLWLFAKAALFRVESLSLNITLMFFYYASHDAKQYY
ncbi:MAG: hypothetical protein K0R12_868 [Gammaproteobacteria bacterium]|jgi:hypothetical protein|nr:hypothetical protein [Gammaproteobacteria bacterium]